MIERTRIDFTYNSRRHRFISLRERYNGEWEACLGAAFDIADVRGSSLGSLVASATAGVPQRAFDLAAALLEEKISREIEASKSRQPTKGIAPKAKGSGPSSPAELDDLLNIIGL